ncbi:phosphoglucosamine mutase [Candidatus Woesearchaeota archaeon]|nr:phosphoglucosamine mutase [Candidatus Woesearchaeota archaeon]
MTPKLFGTDGIRGIANYPPLIPETIVKIGKAIAHVLGGKQKPRILIGKDTRLSGYMIEYALTAGISSMGGNVYLVGPLPTPALAHLVKSLCMDAGIMITASHNPAEHNGIKLFDSQGYKLSDTMEAAIEKAMEKMVPPIKPQDIGKAFRVNDAKARYIEFCKSTIQNRSLKGYKLVIDAANGAAYELAPLIFTELGAEVVVLGNEPNGFNINYQCGALSPESLQKNVLEHTADLGIAFDGDADRLLVVDEVGNLLSGDDLLAGLALFLKQQNKLEKQTLVVTQYSNLGLDAWAKKAGITVLRTPNGDRYVIEEMRKHGYNLGGENSGHLILADHNPTGDGIIAALHVLAMLQQTAKKASSLSSLFYHYPQQIINVKVKEKKPFSHMKSVGRLIAATEKSLGSNGRLLVRYSGTEDMARVMVEAKDQNLVEQTARTIADAIAHEVGAR